VKSADKLIFFGDHFEWQSYKAGANIKNHQITFEEASEVFFFDETQYYADELHSFDEPGLSHKNKLPPTLVGGLVNQDAGLSRISVKK